LRGLTHNLDALTGSPKLRESLDHLDSTLATLDSAAQQTAPKIGPLMNVSPEARWRWFSKIRS